MGWVGAEGGVGWGVKGGEWRVGWGARLFTPALALSVKRLAQATLFRVRTEVSRS
jgi:hypothetical protein